MATGTQQHSDVMNTLRKVVAERRQRQNADIRQATEFWKSALVDAVAERMLNQDTMTLPQIAGIVSRIEEALDGVRVDVDLIIHIDGVCYELCAGSVQL